jgi:hypothetical protein
MIVLRRFGLTVCIASLSLCLLILTTSPLFVFSMSLSPSSTAAVAKTAASAAAAVGGAVVCPPGLKTYLVNTLAQSIAQINGIAAIVGTETSSTDISEKIIGMLLKQVPATADMEPKLYAKSIRENGVVRIYVFIIVCRSSSTFSTKHVSVPAACKLHTL